MFKNMFFKQSLLFLAVFAISGGATMFMMYQTSGNDNAAQENNEPATPAEKMLQSLLNYEVLDVDAKFEAVTGEPLYFQTTANFTGKVDIRNVQALKATGDLEVHASGSNLLTSLTYYSEETDAGIASTMYMDYNNSHIKLEQADLFSFIDMIPSMGEIEVPEELKNIDINKIMNDIPTMEPVQDVDGSFVFELKNVVGDSSIYFKADEAYNCKGIISDYISFNNATMRINVGLNPSQGETEIANPAVGEYSALYQDFTPALNLIAGLQNVFTGSQQTIGLDIKITNTPVNAEPVVYKLNTDISYDMEQGGVSLAANFIEKDRPHKFKMLLDDSKLYINQANINKISLKGASVNELLNFLQREIDKGDAGQINKVLDNIAKIANNPTFDNTIKNIKDILAGNFPTPEPAPQDQQSNNDLSNILLQIQNLNTWISAISVEDGKTTITLDFSKLNINADKINIVLSGNKDQFLGADIVGLVINGTKIDIHLSSKPFDMFTITEMEAQSYVELDSLITLMPNILDLAAQNKFRFEITGGIDDTSAANADVDINAGLQFDLHKKEGYGEATIVDGTKYSHNIKADVKNQQLLVTYNDKMKGHMKTDTLMAIGQTMIDLIQGKDQDFNNAFIQVLDGLLKTPIFKAMRGDIGAIFALENAFVVKSVVVDDTYVVNHPDDIKPLKYLEVAISGELFGFGKDMINIKIVCPEGVMESIEIEGLAMSDTQTMSMRMYIREFKPELEDSRLQIFDDYIDLNDMKVLLDLGIKTVSFEYYHLQGEVSLNLSLFGIPPFDIKSIPLDVKIHNKEGNIIVVATLPEIPVDFSVPILLGKVFDTKEYYNVKERSVTFMYRDNMVYGHRRDFVNDKFAGKYRYVDYKFAATEQNFLDNMMFYMTDFAFSFSQKIMDMINAPAEQTPDTAPKDPIHYENIVTSFLYNKTTDSQKKNNFTVGVNLAEITKNKDLTGCVVTLYEDLTHTFIDQLGLTLRVNLPANCSVGVAINLRVVGHDASLANEFNVIDDFIAWLGARTVSDGYIVHVYLIDPNAPERDMVTDFTPAPAPQQAA